MLQCFHLVEKQGCDLKLYSHISQVVDTRVLAFSVLYFTGVYSGSLSSHSLYAAVIAATSRDK